MKISDFVQFMTFVILYLVLIYYNFTEELSITKDPKSAIIFNNAHKMLIMVSLVFLLGGIIKIMIMRQKFWKIVNTLGGIDNQVNSML